MENLEQKTVESEINDINSSGFEKLTIDEFKKILNSLGNVKRIVKDYKYLSKQITSSTFTDDEIKEISSLLTIHLKLYGGVGLSANQLGIDKRVCIVNVKDPLILINPVITEYSQESVVYREACLSIPNTLRKPKNTIRAKSITVKTDNLGELVFSSDKDEYKNYTDMMSDRGLLECVTAQHEIDHLNGILITDKRRIYSTQIVNDRKYGRNDRVMIKSSDGNDSKFIKYKEAIHYIKKEGYILQ